MVLTLMVSGCVVSQSTKVPGANYARTEPRDVELLYQEPPDTYEVVGFVAVDTGAGADDAHVEQKFRVAGSKLGAQAIIIEALPVHGILTTVQGKGKAVRWKQPALRWHQPW